LRFFLVGFLGFLRVTFVLFPFLAGAFVFLTRARPC
jgi:hypothetical protein